MALRSFYGFLRRVGERSGTGVVATASAAVVVTLLAATSAQAQPTVGAGGEPQVPGQEYARLDVDKAVLDVGKLGWGHVFPGETVVGFIRVAPGQEEGCPHGVFLVNVGNPAGKKYWDDAVAASKTA